MGDQEAKNLIEKFMGIKINLPENSEPFSVKKTALEVNIVDLKGRSFRFPGPFLMSEENGVITFKAKGN